ncbi:MMPL family transporter [Acetobacter sp. TBRC 12305]|uniref:MMPL family transporter n=1 Tax=Acetobacter garciniae TaxID=2817435 RepID=A0A939HL76_9PROT|nr:MMPL family transporter [Acetobacter garciniae]MBO1324795.1 MMPL family transporter [Acetobacter garciniae]MBX0344486.1 MMPL family transporter [Acetobacter garciniae]
MRRNPKRLAFALLVSALLAAVVFACIPLRVDMAGFLPQGHDAGSRFLFREVRGGVAASIITVGIDRAPPAELGRISRAMQGALSQDTRFSVVLNGSFPMADNASLRDVLFTYRYLLAPDPATRDFSSTALAGAFARALDGLQSAAEPLFLELALRDPTGALFDVLRHLQPDVHARVQDGVWFAQDGNRALMLLRTKAAGMNLAAQQAAQDAIRTAFATARPGGARLLLSGPAIFAVQSAHDMRADIEKISILSLCLVIGVLYWRFRSLWVLAAIGVPFLLSLAVAMVVVRVCFGSVHGIAFGFGMTMLGVSLDYPVLLIGHRDAGEGPQATLRRIAPSLRLAVATAVLGLTGMILCGLPGIAQLGTFAAAGLVTAAVVTLFIMPRLIVAADLAPFISGPSAPLARAERLRRWRGLCVLPVLGACAIFLIRPLVMETDLTALSPIPPSARALDQELRRGLGVPDSSHLIVVRGDSPQAVLRQEEDLAPVLASLAAHGALAGVEDAAHILPSAAMQDQRRALLPDDATLAAAISSAQAGLPFRPGSFDRFRADVAAARALQPLTPAGLATTALAPALEPLLFQRDDGWWGIVLPEAVADYAAIRGALAPVPGVMVLDLNQEISALTAYHTRLTLRWTATGMAAALLLLLWGLRDVGRLWRVLSAVGAAMVVLLAILAVRGVPLSLIHLVSMQFVLGVGLDYALFFARPQLDDAERARTMRTLLTCNVMTVLTFALLCLCHTPLLREIGWTVSCGALLCLIFGFMLAGQAAPNSATHSL